MYSSINDSLMGGMRTTPGRRVSRSLQAGCWIGLSLVTTLALSAAPTDADQAPLASIASAGPANPWSFNLTPYVWLTGVKGSYSVGPKSQSVDLNFIDIMDRVSNVPVAFMGHAAVHWERFGFFMEGVYSDLDFKGKSGPRGVIGAGLSSQLGIMDYGVMYRLAGPSPAEDVSRTGKSLSNRLDVYVGGRTFWLTNTLDPKHLSSVSAGATLTAPLLGGRFAVEFGPDWFLMADGDVGGFGADQISFTGSVRGMVGYRFSLADVPTSVEFGYRALRVTTQPASQVETSTTLNGPFLGMTAWW